MNSPRISPNSPIPSPNAEPHLAFESWRTLLDECSRKPSRKHVHFLRVATLRLQAQLDHMREIHHAGHSAARAATRWNKHAEKLRESLSAVREIDVFRDKLSALRGTLDAPSGYSPRTSRACSRQIEELEIWLKGERKAAAKKLIADLEHRKEQLERLSLDLETTQALGYSLLPVSSSSGVFKMHGEAIVDFPNLDADCLHDFRKRIKNVRYLAELFAKTDRKAARLAMVLKTMQGAIGEWHDSQQLAQLASRQLRKPHKGGVLTRLLETLSQESLQKALETCQSQNSHLDTGIADTAARPQLVARKPPMRSVDTIPELGAKRLA
jgi:CHAD domain-containing protein